MKRWVPFAVVAFAVTACQDASGPTAKLLPVAPKAALITAANPIPGSYIVVMKDAVADVDGEVDQIGQHYGVSANYRYKYALKGFAGKLSAAAVEALRRDPRVAYIEEDQLAHIVGVQPNPPSWGLDRIDQRPSKLDLSYTYNQTGAGVDAYIIDTGIRTTHNEFGGRAVFGTDAIVPSATTATDGNGHGTHVAGTVGGSTYGVAKGVHLVSVRVLDANGSGSYSQVIAGIDWVTADHTTHPAVANMSLGGPVDAALDQAVRNSIADGVTYCIAAGNSSADASTSSPADVKEAITVGATDNTDAFAYFSNYGSLVDILAPGVNITSSWNTSNTATNTISGTSMATPHVTGVAALYLEANPLPPASAPASVQSALISNATVGVITGVPAGTANRLLYSIFGPPPPPPPAAPAPASPGNGATGVTVPVALSWSASTGSPTSYRVQVSTSSAFSTLTYDQSGITGTSTSVSGLVAGVLYYWRVNASNAGGAGAWSTVWSFTTAPPPTPDAPILTSPAKGATVTVPVSLTWNSAANATTYRVVVSTSSTFAGTAAYDQTVTTTSTSVSTLSPSTVYYWHVIAGNTGTAKTASLDWSFTTAAPPPVPAPVITLSPTTFTFSAAQGTNPANQTLRITNSGGGTLSWAASSDKTWLTLSPASGTATSTAVVVRTTGLVAGTYTATITVSGSGTGGAATPKTATVTLTVTAAPAPCTNGDCQN